MPAFETRSSQFGLVSGIRQTSSDMVLVAEPAGLFAPEARKGQLYIVAEADQDVARGRDACQLAGRTIRKLFYGDSSYSVTSALRKAISAANKALYEHNFSVSPAKRAVVGVTCAVIKGNDLYIAQILPAQAYVLSDGKLRAIPTVPAWSQPETGLSTFIKPGALGASLSVEPEFYRALLRPGDALLLCSSNLARLLGATALACVFAAAGIGPVWAQATEVMSANVPANSQMLLEADTLVYDNDNDIVTAAGSVKIDYGGNKLVAQRVVYNRKKFAEAGIPMFVSNSFSKSFSLYGERIGALSVVAASTEEAARVLSQLKRLVRTNYSNPPTHGGKIVASVLTTPELLSMWQQELGQMRNRILTTREQLVEKVHARAPGAALGFVAKQRGMFSYSGLSKEAVGRLRQEYSIYALDSGRICVAAINSRNIGYVADAIARVMS